MVHLLKTIKFCFCFILEVTTIYVVFMFIVFFDSVTFTTIISIKFGELNRQQAAGKDLIGPKELFVKEAVKVFMLKIYTTISFVYHLDGLIHCSLGK